MPDVIIRDVEDATFRTIALQAEVQKKSVDEVVRNLIRLGLLHDVEGRVAVADRIRSTTRPSEEDSTDVFRRMRDAI